MTTIPAEVTLDTPLSALDLSWDAQSLPAHERVRHVHRLHPAVGPYVPQLAEVFLRRFWRAGQTVYDPFAGPGTTLVEANALGIHAFGCAASAFDELVCRAKTAAYDPERAEREARDIVARTSAAWEARTAQLELMPVDAPADRDYLQVWFAPAALAQLLQYRALISEYEYTDLLRVTLARAARAARRVRHDDLAQPAQPVLGPYWCDRHERVCRPHADARELLRRGTENNLARLAEFAHLRTAARTTVLAGDPQVVQPPGPVDGILTALPLPGPHSAASPHRYAEALLALPAPRPADDYAAAVLAALRNAVSALPAGAPVVIVLTGPTGLYGDLAGACGCEAEAVIPRTAYRRSGRHDEQVLVWRAAGSG